jgi:hypothetical protein
MRDLSELTKAVRIKRTIKRDKCLIQIKYSSRPYGNICVWIVGRADDLDTRTGKMKTTEHHAMTGAHYRDGNFGNWRPEHYPYSDSIADISRPFGTPLGGTLAGKAMATPLAICTLPIWD